MRGEQGQRSTTEPRHIEANARAVHALAMRQRGHSYRAIAAQLGVSLSTAHGYVADALAELRAQTAEEVQMLRDLEAQKLDRVERYLWRALRTASAADVAKLANSLRLVSESRRKLFGLDAPVDAEPTGNLYTVLAASPDCPAWDRPAQSASPFGLVLRPPSTS